MYKRLILTVALILAVSSLSAQEFRCAVSVNYQKLLTTTQGYASDDKKVFDNMKQAIEDFVNSRKLTNLEVQSNEMIECGISIILSERTSATDFKGQLSIQLKRPVYNSNYTTGLFNYIENNDFMFSYTEGQPLDFDINTFYSNLSSALGYYMYIMLGLYFDSFGEMGGTPFYEVAQTICQTASNSGYKGWRSSESQKARYWFMENHTNSAYANLRLAYYYYNRLGLDMMTKDQQQARQNIIQALKYIQQVHKVRTNLLSVQAFFDAKISEIVSIFTPAPPEEQKEVYLVIKEVSPSNVVKLQGFNTK
ncbi:MAG: DUF4835 family protein [Bacteroidales bacterium]|nr:DUF4835 family protein [Bacteroidales bacterium]